MFENLAAPLWEPCQFLEKQIHLEHIYPVETMSLVKKIPPFGNSPVFLWISGCCYGYFDYICNWWVGWVDLVWLAASTVWLQPTVRLQLYRMLSEKWSCECTNKIWGIFNGYDKPKNCCSSKKLKKLRRNGCNTRERFFCKFPGGGFYLQGRLHGVLNMAFASIFRFLVNVLQWQPSWTTVPL